MLSNGDLVTKTFKPTQVRLQLDRCTEEEVGKEVIDGSPSNFMNEQLTCTNNQTYCGVSKYCYLPSKSVTVQFKPNTSTFDCQEKVGQGYYIVVSSIQVGPSPNKPHSDPNSGGGPGCSWDQSLGSYFNVTIEYPINGIPRAIEAKTYWQAHSGVPMVSCNHDQADGWITSVQCTNDTSTFVSN